MSINNKKSAFTKKISDLWDAPVSSIISDKAKLEEEVLKERELAEIERQKNIIRGKMFYKELLTSPLKLALIVILVIIFGMMFYDKMETSRVRGETLEYQLRNQESEMLDGYRR